MNNVVTWGIAKWDLFVKRLISYRHAISKLIYYCMCSVKNIYFRHCNDIAIAAIQIDHAVSHQVTSQLL